MTIEIVYDSTEQISASIEEVFKTIAEAVAIVVVVILLFLGSFRSVLMPIVTIPLSLIGVCFLLFSVGYSINLLSLLAMVLAIGLVVDDAIVVVENIHRHMEEDHMSPMQAAFNGMREISSAIVAMTMTLAAVFAPLAFTGGLTGALFREFAVTLAGSVVISGIVAITITPMMSARLLKAGAPSRFQRIVDGTFERVERVYERLVDGLAELPPGDADDRHRAGRADRLHVHQDLERTGAGRGPGLPAVARDRAALRDVGLYRDLRQPDARPGQGHAGNAGAVLGRRLRRRDQQRLRRLRLQGLGRTRPAARRSSRRTSRAASRKVAGVEAFVFAPPTLPGSGGGLPITMVVRSTGDASEVFEVAEEIKNKAQASGRFIVVQNSMAYDAPQVTVTIDRDRAAALNLPIADIGRTLTLAGRRRRSGAVRPRFQQLRHHPAGAAGIPRQSREAGRVFRAQRRPARWCRCLRW